MEFFSTYNPENKSAQFLKIFEQTKVIHVRKSIFNNTISSFYKDLASQCGIPLVYEEDPTTGKINFDKWTEIKYVPEKSTDTYKHSNKFQPLHTDYGYFSFEIFASFFYCSEQAEFGGATTFIDVDAVAGILKQVDVKLFESIQKQKIHFGRSDSPLAHNNDLILQKDELGWKINWNYYRALKDENNQTLVADFKAFLDHYLEKSGELKELKLQPGEGVFFHDRRVLHGRNSFVGNRQLNKGGIAKNLPVELLNMIPK